MSDILDLIDGAIHAHDLSADAMRWSPEPVDEYRIVAYGVDGSTVVAVTHDGHYTIFDEVHEWGPVMRFPASLPWRPLETYRCPICATDEPCGHQGAEGRRP
jgi:hypothetical protein